jgi:hypothetical protein
MNEIRNPQAKLKIAEIEAMTPATMVENDIVADKFVMLFNNIHGTKDGEMFYHKEKFNFLKIISETPALQTCSKISLYGVFLDIAVNGLSLDNTGGRSHCYVIKRKAKSGKKDEKGRDLYEDRASLMISGYGELVMRQRAGQVKYVDNPVIIYENDHFQPSFTNGQKMVSYRGEFPRTSNKIVGAFIRIVRTDNSVDFEWLLESDIDRLKAYSAKGNSYWDNDKKKMVAGDANALYSSANGGVDPGFLEAKMIKHAFDAYPKVRTGNFTAFETQEPAVPALDYGIEDIEAHPALPASAEENDFENAEVVTESDAPQVEQEPKEETF